MSKKCNDCKFIAEKADGICKGNMGFCKLKPKADVYYGSWKGLNTKPEFGDFMPACKRFQEKEA